MDIALSTSTLDTKTSDNNATDISQCIQNILVIPFQEILSNFLYEEKPLLQSEETKTQEPNDNTNDNYFLLDASNFNIIKDTFQDVKNDSITNVETNNQNALKVLYNPVTLGPSLDNTNIIYTPNNQNILDTISIYNQNTDYINENSQSNNIINSNNYSIEQQGNCKNNEYTKNQINNLEKYITSPNTNINSLEVSKTNKNLDIQPTLISNKDLTNQIEERESVNKSIYDNPSMSQCKIEEINTDDSALYQNNYDTHNVNQDMQEEENRHGYNNHHNNKFDTNTNLYTNNFIDNNITCPSPQSQLQESIWPPTQLQWNYQETLKYHESYKTRNINNLDIETHNNQLKVNFDIINENENAELEISFNDNTSVEITFKTNQYIGLLNKSMYLIRNILQEFGYNNIVIKQENNSNNNTNKKLSNTYIAEEDDEKFFNKTYTKQRINSENTNTIHNKLLDKQVFGYI